MKKPPRRARATGRDFSGFDLRDSLQEWKVTRKQIFNFVSNLPEESLMLLGTHAAFGKITVLDVLKMMLDHDQEHIQHLESSLSGYRSSSATGKTRRAPAV